MSVLPTVAELCIPGSTLNISLDLIKLFDCINFIKMFGSG